MKSEQDSIMERCMCGCEVVRLGWLVDVYDGETLSFDCFASLYYHGFGWREKLRAIWDIIRGCEHYMWEVVLGPSQAQRMAEFISGHLEKREEGGIDLEDVEEALKDYVPGEGISVLETHERMYWLEGEL